MSDSKIKFVAVELLKKGSSNATSVEYGLFKGMKIRSDGNAVNPEVVSFVLIEKQGEEDSILALNLANFNILSISSRCDSTKELVIYKSHTTDQDKAASLLLGLLGKLRKDNRMVKNDPEIIDISSYTNLPGAIQKVTPKYPNSASSMYGNTYNHNTTSEWQRKKEEKEKEEKRQEELRKIPAVFKRDDEIPGIKALNLMKKKVLMIAAGDYESDLVPSKDKDDDDEKPVGFVAG